MFVLWTFCTMKFCLMFCCLQKRKKKAHTQKKNRKKISTKPPPYIYNNYRNIIMFMTQSIIKISKRGKSENTLKTKITHKKMMNVVVSRNKHTASHHVYFFFPTVFTFFCVLLYFFLFISIVLHSPSFVFLLPTWRATLD